MSLKHFEFGWTLMIMCSIQHKAGLWKVLKWMCLFTALIGYTIKVIEGSTIHLPCHFQSSSQVRANALWYKETDEGMRTLLNFEESTTGDNGRVEQLYPMDHDQTIIVRDAAMKDAGIYNCESVEGEQLSTVQVIVEGRSGNLFCMLLTHSLQMYVNIIYVHASNVRLSFSQFVLPLFLTHAAASPQHGSPARTRTVARQDPCCRSPCQSSPWNSILPSENRSPRATCSSLLSVSAWCCRICC